MISKIKNSRDLTIVFLTVTSIFGLVLSIFFVGYPPVLGDYWAFRGLTAGSAFCAVCILGIFAALFPRSCSKMPSFGKSNGDQEHRPLIHAKNLSAHHPLCGSYSNHVLHIGNRRLCATCSGLSVGAFGVIVGTIMYFFGSFRVGTPQVLVLVGGLAVIAGLCQSALPKLSNGIGRFFFSIIFVAGSFLMIVGLDMAVESITIDLFFVALSILLIMTKIAFSQRDHLETCSECIMESCRPDRK